MNSKARTRMKNRALRMMVVQNSVRSTPRRAVNTLPASAPVTAQARTLALQDDAQDVGPRL